MEQNDSIQSDVMSSKNVNNQEQRDCKQSNISNPENGQSSLQCDVSCAPREELQALQLEAGNERKALESYCISVEKFDCGWEENLPEAILEESSCGDDWDNIESLSPNVYSFASAKSSNYEQTDSEEVTNMQFDGERASNSFASRCISFPQKVRNDQGISQLPQSFEILDPLDDHFEFLLLPDSTQLKEEVWVDHTDLELARDHVIAELLCFENKNRSYNNDTLTPLYTPEELQELKELEMMRRAATSQK